MNSEEHYKVIDECVEEEEMSAGTQHSEETTTCSKLQGITKLELTRIVYNALILFEHEAFLVFGVTFLHTFDIWHLTRLYPVKEHVSVCQQFLLCLFLLC